MKMKYPDKFINYYGGRLQITPIKIIRNPSLLRGPILSTKKNLENGTDSYIPVWSPLVFKSSIPFWDSYAIDERTVKWEDTIHIHLNSNFKVVDKNESAHYGIRELSVRIHGKFIEICISDWVFEEYKYFNKYADILIKDKLFSK